MSNKILETGQWYWYKQIADRTWRICYIGEDPDEIQWMCTVNSKPMSLDDMDLDFFDFASVGPPPNSMPQTIGDMIDEIARMNPEFVKHRIEEVNRKYKNGELPRQK